MRFLFPFASFFRAPFCAFTDFAVAPCFCWYFKLLPFSPQRTLIGPAILWPAKKKKFTLSFLERICDTLDFQCLSDPAALRTYRAISFSLLQHPIYLQSFLQTELSYLPIFWSNCFLERVKMFCFVVVFFVTESRHDPWTLVLKLLSLPFFPLRTSSSRCPLSDTIRLIAWIHYWLEKSMQKSQLVQISP